MRPKNVTEFEIFLQQQGLFELLGVEKIGVFGSFARNEPFNDIDIFIEGDISASRLLSFHETLETKLDIPIDIVLEKYAEPIIVMKAKKDMQYAKRA
jgi:uncharacterized protein